MSEESYQIAPARTGADMDAVRALFDAYTQWLALDLSFQDYAGELVSLPGKYAPPAGELLLARDACEVPVGCVALRALDVDGCCEMKRLYVAPEMRGRGLGKALAAAIIAAAVRLGYREMRLDTLPKLEDATALYRRMGFRPIPAYYETPIADTLFFGLSLSAVNVDPAT